MPRSATPRPARRGALSVLIALLGLLVLVAPVSAAPPHRETWHRLNPATDDVAAEHERLQCMSVVQWVCRYDKVPEQDLNWDRTIGTFHGRDFAFTDADCPDWFPTEICEGTEQVIVGPITYAVDEGGAFRTGHALLFTDGEGDIAPLYVYWFDAGFVCPWYESFDDALAANPTGEQDCIFAPEE
jgi:hypothetical protein